jgi:hypothetical protein
VLGCDPRLFEGELHPLKVIGHRLRRLRNLPRPAIR